MCLFPRLIKNPKYKSNKKNGGKIPPITDTRVLVIPIGCGQCMECRKQKKREWQVRLNEEVKEPGQKHMITLTLSNESYQQINNTYKEINEAKGYDKDNAIATKAVNLQNRHRKKNLLPSDLTKVKGRLQAKHLIIIKHTSELAKNNNDKTNHANKNKTKSSSSSRISNPIRTLRT
jgi:hypothetical protein